MSLVVGYSNLTVAPQPIQAIDIIAAGALSPNATFSRLSVGKYWDASGVLQTAAAGAPRWDHDPVTGAALGLLVEQQSTNRVQYSNALVAGYPNAAYNPRITITQNAATGPLGAGTAALFTPTDLTNTGQHGYGPNGGPLDVNASDVWTFSVYLGRAGTDLGQIKVDNNYGGITEYDLSTGQVTPDSYVAAAGISHWNNGFRVWSAGTVYPSDERYSFLNLGILGSTVAAGGIYASCMQCEFSSGPTSYIATNGATATRAKDVLTYPAPGAQSTLVFTHDASSGAHLLDSNSTTLLTSSGAGKTAIAWDATGSMIVANGGAGTAGGVLTFGSDITLFDNANAHCSSAKLYPYRMTEAQMQAATT